MSSEQTTTPDQRSIDDQLISIVRLANAAGHYDGADWIQKVAAERVEALIVKVGEPELIAHAPSEKRAVAFVRALDAATASEGVQLRHCDSPEGCARIAPIGMRFCCGGCPSMPGSEARHTTSCDARNAKPPSPPPFTSEEARERAARGYLYGEDAKRAVATLRSYADLLERDDALERAAEELLIAYDQCAYVDAERLAIGRAPFDHYAEQLRSVLAQRAKGKQ